MTTDPPLPQTWPIPDHPDPSAPTSPPILLQTLTTLTPTLEILSRFHHRNKNQHRIAKWWSSADLLRRHLRKLLEAVDAQVTKLERRGAKSKVKKWKEKETKEDEIARRAGYLRGLVPSAYLAFTQLTADKQFAQLGLMLLGVLAQVDAALAVFSEGLVQEGSLEGEMEVGEESPHVTMGGDGMGRSYGVMADVGITVSREDIGVAIPRMESAVTVAREEVGVTVSKEDVVSKPTARLGKEPTVVKLARHLKDEARGAAGKELPVVEDQVKARTKRKKGKVDEFDGIFDSLEKSIKRPKKKKRKEDEFDKLFAGL